MEKKELLFTLENGLKAIFIGLLATICLFFKSNVKAIETNDKSNINKIFTRNESIDFYMFASFSLSEDILRQMLDYAKLYNGIIVLRGIKNNSFQETSEHIQHLTKEGEEAGIIIDPTLFKRYAVERVPSYILLKQEKCPAGMSCNPIHDKVTGNITPKYALEKFSEKGDLFQEAKNLLRVHK
jgi:type-F conjugative transfer system pilin assembly protein TrbC